MIKAMYKDLFIEALRKVRNTNYVYKTDKLFKYVSLADNASDCLEININDKAYEDADICWLIDCTPKLLDTLGLKYKTKEYAYTQWEGHTVYTLEINKETFFKALKLFVA